MCINCLSFFLFAVCVRASIYLDLCFEREKKICIHKQSRHRRESEIEDARKKEANDLSWLSALKLALLSLITAKLSRKSVAFEMQLEHISSGSLAQILFSHFIFWKKKEDETNAIENCANVNYIKH